MRALGSKASNVSNIPLICRFSAYFSYCAKRFARHQLSRRKHFTLSGTGNQTAYTVTAPKYALSMVK